MTYNKDPRWVTSKRDGQDRDGRRYRKGDRIFFYPIGKTVLAGEAAERAAARFEAERQDDEVGGRP